MSSTETAVALKPKRSRKQTIAPRSSDSAALIDMLTRASRDPSVDIGKMQWLLDARTKILEDEAEQDWNDAMSAAQAEMVPIAKDASNPQTQSRYATYLALDRPLRPIYTSHGFALSFDTGKADNPLDILVLCYVTRGRHKRTYQIPMPADGKGPKGGDVMSRTHATGSAVTYGKRYLLIAIFNLAIAEKDDDGNRAGGPAPSGQGQETPAKPINGKQLKSLMSAMHVAGIEDQRVITEFFGVAALTDLTVAQWSRALKKCKKTQEWKDKKAQERSAADAN